jgi:hypothetical protein
MNRMYAIKDAPMSSFHSDQNPRHRRLFELLQQQDKADQNCIRTRNLTFRRATPDEIEQIKIMAAKSIRRQA